MRLSCKQSVAAEQPFCEDFLMINDETETEILVSAYAGQGGSYQVTYDARFDPFLVEQRYSNAIRGLQSKDLINVQHVYSSNTSTHPVQSICCLTRRGVKYIENNNLATSDIVASHQQGRRLAQEMEDAEKTGDVERKDRLYASFRQIDIKFQDAAKQYEHLK